MRWIGEGLYNFFFEILILKVKEIYLIIYQNKRLIIF